MAAEGSTARGRHEGVLPRIHICPHPHGITASARLTLPSLLSRDKRCLSLQLGPEVTAIGFCTANTGTVCLQNHGASPRPTFTLKLEVADLSKLLGDKGLLLQAPRATFLSLARSPSSSGKKPEIHKGKRREEKPKRSGQQSSLLCELPTCLFDPESSLMVRHH